MVNFYEEMFHNLQKDYFELNSAYDNLDLQFDIVLGLGLVSFLINIFLIYIINTL